MEQQDQETAAAPGRAAAARLRFLAELGSRLAAAGDPRALLQAAYPAVLAARERPAATAALCRRRAGAMLDPGDIAFAQAATRLAELALAKAELQARLDDERQVVHNLETVAELQQSLQPDCDPTRMPIWGVNLPARKVSGDFFDFYRLDEERIVFSLGDVAGKGMQAALLMAKTISLFRCLGKRIERPARLLEAINAELCETATRGLFVTMVAGHYWMGSGKLCFANAGHEPPLLRRRDRSYGTFPAKVPPLGIQPLAGLEEESLELDGGEFYVFTDGLTEYRYLSGEQLGVEGLIQLVEALAAEPLARRLAALLDTLERDAGWEARDDLTILAIDDSWVRADVGIDDELKLAAS